MQPERAKSQNPEASRRSTAVFRLNYPVSNCPRLRRRAALVIGGGVALIFKKPTKRKAGQRAGMTRAKIVDAAVKLWDSAGPEGFTIRKLALQLKVVPTTIRAHVKGGIGELRREVARRVLADLTRPYKPNQDPNDYLREFFRSALASFRQRPTLARLVTFRSEAPAPRRGPPSRRGRRSSRAFARRT